MNRLCPKVFISHTSDDLWVATQIETYVRSCGADSFLDSKSIEVGDDFDEKLILEAEDSTELLVLFTPATLKHHYIWMEIGMFVVSRKRIVAVLYGVTKEKIATNRFMPIALKRVSAVEINNIDSYFSELKKE